MIKDEIQKCLSVLKTGGIILYPTDTIWGLGCDATQPLSIAKIQQLKNRPNNKSMILLFANWIQVADYFGDLGKLPTIAKQYTDRPTTFVFYPITNDYPYLLAPDGSIAIRVTAESFSQQLCLALNAPLISTSANLTDQPAPHIFADIDEQIKQGVDYIVNYGQQVTQPIPASRIIKYITNQPLTIIRD